MRIIKKRKDKKGIKMEYILFLTGLIIIIKASDIFLDKAIYISKAMGISEAAIGATLVSFCTVLPETVISVSASLDGDTGMAFGNTIGSVICNTALILGTAMIIAKPVLKHTKQLFKNAVYIIVLSTLTLILFVKFHQIPRISGAIFLVFAFLSVLGNGKKDKGAAMIVVRKNKLFLSLFVLVINAVVIGISSEVLVSSGQKIASDLGVPSMIIGLILTAVGSSLPEFVTCITAIKKNAPEISFGNILGANILNLGMINGICSLISPMKADVLSSVFYCLTALVFTCYLILCFSRKSKKMYPADGIIMVASYFFFLYISVLYC